MLFGSKKLPVAARGPGKSMRILKSEAKAMKDEGSARSTAATTESTPAEPVPQVIQASPGETSGHRDERGSLSRTGVARSCSHGPVWVVAVPGKDGYPTWPVLGFHPDGLSAVLGVWDLMRLPPKRQPVRWSDGRPTGTVTPDDLLARLLHPTGGVTPRPRVPFLAEGARGHVPLAPRGRAGPPVQARDSRSWMAYDGVMRLTSVRRRTKAHAAQPAAEHNVEIAQLWNH